MDDVDQAAYVDVQVDCTGVVWFMDRTSISKWDPDTGARTVIFDARNPDVGLRAPPACAPICPDVGVCNDSPTPACDVRRSCSDSGRSCWQASEGPAPAMLASCQEPLAC